MRLATRMIRSVGSEKSIATMPPLKGGGGITQSGMQITLLFVEVLHQYMVDNLLLLIIVNLLFSTLFTTFDISAKSMFSHYHIIDSLKDKEQFFIKGKHFV